MKEKMKNIKNEMKYDLKKTLFAAFIAGILITLLSAALVQQNTSITMTEKIEIENIPPPPTGRAAGDDENVINPVDETGTNRILGGATGLFEKMTEIVFPYLAIEVSDRTEDNELYEEKVSKVSGFPFGYIGKSFIQLQFIVLPVGVPPEDTLYLHYISISAILLNIIIWTVVSLVAFKLVFYAEDKLRERPKRSSKFSWTGAEGPREYRQPSRFRWR